MYIGKGRGEEIKRACRKRCTCGGGSVNVGKVKRIAGMYKGMNIEVYVNKRAEKN